MRKVLIVDDEILSIRMLTQIIDWERCGIRICASAEDGVEALKQVELHHPDIILTDIRMPHMDGLEFIQRVRETRPETEFILISGYADFSYVKQAMEMGCSHYILKPVDEKELEAAIGSVMDKIGKKERQEELREENQRLKIRRQLGLLMRAGGGREESGRLAEQIPEGLGHYRLAGILIEENSINDHVEHASRLSLGLETLEGRLEACLNRSRPCLLLDYEDGCFTVMAAEREETPFAEWAREVCDYFRQEFEMKVRVCFTLPYDTVSALPTAFLRLSNLERFSFYVGETPVLGYGFNCEENEFDELDILDRTKVMGQAVAGHDIGAAKAIMAEVLELSLHLNPASLHLVYEFCYNVVCSIRDQLAREGRMDGEEHPVMKFGYGNLSEISTVQELGQVMDEILGCLAGEAKESQAVYGRMVQEGIQYLERHFDSNISLDSLCAELAVSKNYFCYLFKRETGENIWSYLTEIRLKRSRELLVTTDYKSYEIAYMVGYDNPSYFSRLFKKCTGQTPNEYRAAHVNKKGVRKGGAVMKISWIPGEYWYGGTVSSGVRQPVGQGDVLEMNLNPNSTPNQAMPFFLSSKGRYLWREEGFLIRFDGEGIACPDDVELGEGLGSLRGAYLEGMRRHFPFRECKLSKRLFERPVYNTWIELTFNQSQEAVLAYARGIVEHGLEPGVLMIDDGWSECYGDWRFHGGKFPDPKGMIEELKGMGFSVMVWVCPFVTPDSVSWREAEKKGILVLHDDGTPWLARWWNGYSGALDFAREEAVTWFDGQMKGLLELGVDGFKFDAGDSIYYPDGMGNEQSRLWAGYGERYEFNEYRVSWKAGGYSLMQRLCDKDHSWGETGIGALIPDTLIQGLTGHPYCCPDLVGGGEYLNFAEEAASGLDQELFLCHGEIACMMPVIQFSAAPWRVLEEEKFKGIKEQLGIRKKYEKERMEALRQAVKTGEPVIRSMEYAFPGQGLERVMDQFMMGDRLLVAPCLKKGENGREVALPEGRWRYGGQVLEGGGRRYLERENAGPLILEYETLI